MTAPGQSLDRNDLQLRRPTGPALVGAAERTRLREPERERDLLGRGPRGEQLVGTLAPNVVDERAQRRAFLLEVAAQRARADAERAADRGERGVARCAVAARRARSRNGLRPVVVRFADLRLERGRRDRIGARSAAARAASVSSSSSSLGAPNWTATPNTSACAGVGVRRCANRTARNTSRPSVAARARSANDANKNSVRIGPRATPGTRCWCSTRDRAAVLELERRALGDHAVEPHRALDGIAHGAAQPHEVAEQPERPHDGEPRQRECECRIAPLRRELVEQPIDPIAVDIRIGCGRLVDVERGEKGFGVDIDSPEQLRQWAKQGDR